MEERLLHFFLRGLMFGIYMFFNVYKQAPHLAVFFFLTSPNLAVMVHLVLAPMHFQVS